MTETDGRVARSQRTRAAVIDALLDLLQEGDPDPNARQIAERAGVSLRSIYVHFASIEDLYEALAQLATARVLEMLSPIDPAADVDVRIDSLCSQRARINEEIGPIRRAATLREPSSTALAEQRRFARRASRDQIERVFAAELDRLPPPERRRRLAAVDVVISGESWDLMRTTHRLAVREATVSMREAVTMLLDAS
jgi:AcrR family transcriptional regulator